MRFAINVEIRALRSGEIFVAKPRGKSEEVSRKLAFGVRWGSVIARLSNGGNLRKYWRQKEGLRPE